MVFSAVYYPPSAVYYPPHSPPHLRAWQLHASRYGFDSVPAKTIITATSMIWDSSLPPLVSDGCPVGVPSVRHSRNLPCPANLHAADPWAILLYSTRALPFSALLFGWRD